MKIAATISGLPRFTKEFDEFLKNIHDYDEVDWFFYMWNNFKEDDRISPWMNNPDNWNEESVRAKIESNLPAGHRIVHLELVDQPVYNVTRPLNLTPWTSPQGVWYMHYGLKMINQIRLDYEKEHGKYDLILRARPDVEVYPSLNLRQVTEYITQNPNAIITSANHRLGLQGHPISELFAASGGDAMSVYCGVFDKLFEYNDQGVLYHPETLSGHHLHVNGIVMPMTNFEIRFRYHKQPDGVTLDWGRWN